MTHTQCSIFDYVQIDEDPLYHQLRSLSPKETVQIGEYFVSLNTNDIYEIFNDDIHEGKSTLEKCYEFMTMPEQSKI